MLKGEETLTDGEERVLLEVAGDLGKDMVFPGTATVLVKLNNQDLPEMHIPVTVYRKRDHEVRFSPQQVAFGVVRSGAAVRKAITVELPKSAKYAVESAEPSGEGVNVTIEEKPKASKHVTLLRCELDTSGIKGKVEQELRISVSVPDGPPEVYKLPISGFVKPAENEQASNK